MITRMPRSCVVHRAALLDFLDGQPRTSASAAALSHLERCRACEEELAGIVRTVAALRRLGRTAALVEPPGHAWPTLRARVTRRRADRWLPRFSIAGVAVSAALAVMIGLPATITPGGADWSFTDHRTAPGRTEEARPLRPPAQRTAGRQAVTPTVGVAVSASASGRHFDRRVYGEAAWSPQAGAPKPRPR
jgi:anti-sigma factor RsiW